MTNGTRQGSIFSPRGGFSSYIDPLIEELRNCGHGLSILNQWYGSVFYADDGILLSTTINGLQEMVNIVANRAEENGLVLSTDKNLDKSKTKCMAFHNKVPKEELPPILLNNVPLPWKSSANHIGQTLQSDGTMSQDLREKRGQYIDRCMTLNQEFLFASPDVKLRMARLYNSHFSGSNNWTFDSDMFGQLCRSYNVNLRAIYDLPHGTHSWIVEQLSGGVTRNN